MITFNFNLAFAEDTDEEKQVPIEISLEERENLISLGFTEEEIQNMSSEEYLLNKDLEGEVVASTTQFLKVIEPIQTSKYSTFSSSEIQSVTTQKPVIIEMDEESYYNELAMKDTKNTKEFSTSATSDYTTTSYKKMTTLITKLSTNNYRLKNSVVWSKIPANKHVDVSGIGINQTYWAPTPGSQYAKQNWTKYSICTGTEAGSATYTTSSTKWSKGAGGYAVKMNLPNNDFGGGCYSQTVRSLSSYMYYSVKPLTSTNRLDAYGQYAHQEATYTLTPSISLSGVSFSVSPVAKFSVHPNTHALVYK